MGLYVQKGLSKGNKELLENYLHNPFSGYAHFLFAQACIVYNYSRLNFPSNLVKYLEQMGYYILNSTAHI